ncbi:MAG: fumarylacetoacetate hydrolase family protein [Candidatus Marinimicrobia bacterium]|jgi:acylpyruvate hydrolase|nr:fumarylacetoacetate hydrolase family protein [Candidatus Neomarinimicrobiota bacterium]HJM46970.1 fumarylacetoacetate hydrolase family protein [Candidatus Neomarinimicrobiota bacterium]|tara:strand:+ start:5011 stop:5667 length:657 start_codon:yes stop_codon:yes gene_type:complete
MKNKLPTVRNTDKNLIEVRNIYCVGRNYISHAEELNNIIPTEPIFFQKSISALTNSSEIITPENINIQHELEVVVLIRSSGYKIKVKNAMNYVDGYGLGLDLTDRKMQEELKSKKLPWFLSKNFRYSAILTDFIHWNDSKWNSVFWLEKNQVRVQKGEMSNMIHSVGELIEFLSHRIPLMAGDVIFTGTPGGVGPIEKGDELKLGLGNNILKVVKIIN